METFSEWEPHPFELGEMNAREYEKEIEELGELWLIEDAYLKNRNFMQELAEEAWYYFVTIYSKNPKTPDLFLESVVSVLPHISNRIKDKREIMISLVEDVASRLSKMLLENRRKRENRQKLYLKKHRSYAETKAIHFQRALEATDVLEHGTSHGELLLAGIVPKNPPKNWKRRKFWKQRPKREHIPFDDQLGSIVAQADEQSFIKAFGHKPVYT